MHQVSARFGVDRVTICFLRQRKSIGNRCIGCRGRKRTRVGLERSCKNGGKTRHLSKTYRRQTGICGENKKGEKRKSLSERKLYRLLLLYYYYSAAGAHARRFIIKSVLAAKEARGGPGRAGRTLSGGRRRWLAAAAAGASQECARGVRLLYSRRRRRRRERIIDFSRAPINYVRGRPFPCWRT